MENSFFTIFEIYYVRSADIDSKGSFLRDLLEAMYDELPAPKKEEVREKCSGKRSQLPDKEVLRKKRER